MESLAADRRIENLRTEDQKLKEENLQLKSKV
jgi:hypothetical protein